MFAWLRIRGRKCSPERLVAGLLVRCQRRGTLRTDHPVLLVDQRVLVRSQQATEFHAAWLSASGCSRRIVGRTAGRSEFVPRLEFLRRDLVKQSDRFCAGKNRRRIKSRCPGRRRPETRHRESKTNERCIQGKTCHKRDEGVIRLRHHVRRQPNSEHPNFWTKSERGGRCGSDWQSGQHQSAETACCGNGTAGITPSVFPGLRVDW